MLFDKLGRTSFTYAEDVANLVLSPHSDLNATRDECDTQLARCILIDLKEDSENISEASWFERSHP